MSKRKILPMTLVMVPLWGCGVSRPITSGELDVTSQISLKAKPSAEARAKALYQEGLVAFVHNLHAALSLFREASKVDPQLHRAVHGLGTVQERLGDLPEAAKSYRRAHEAAPRVVIYGISYALLLAKLGQWDQALGTLTSLPEAGSAKVLTAIAEVHSLRGDSPAAQQVARQACKVDLGYAPALVVIARDHYRQGRLALALFTLEAILDGRDAKYPARVRQSAEAHGLRGVILHQRGRRGEAERALGIATSLRPDFAAASLLLGAYQHESGNSEAAVYYLQGAVRHAPPNVEARLLLAEALRSVELYEESKRHLEQVLERDGDRLEAHYNLGLVYLQAPNLGGMTERERLDEAIASFERCERLRPEGAPVISSSLALAKARRAALSKPSAP